MYKLLRFHPTQYNAFYSIRNEYFMLSPPFIHATPITNEDTIASLNDDLCIKSFKTAEGLRDHLISQYYFSALNNFYDLIKKINEGSLIVETVADLNKKLTNKIESFAFLKDDNPLLLRHFLHTFWLLVGMDGHNAEDFYYDILKGTKIDALIKKDMKLFSNWDTDKKKLIKTIKDKYQPRFKREKKWEAYKNACFTLYFLSDLMDYSDKDDLKSEYNVAVEEFEANTGKDAHHTPFQRHSDRWSRQRHVDDKWNKRQKRIKENQEKYKKGD